LRKSDNFYAATIASIILTKAVQKPSARASIRFIEPMQCLAVAKLPEGPQWEYEVKFDGYRMLGLKNAKEVRLISRNGNDFTSRYPSIVRALAKLPEDTVVDGEIVALDENGEQSFNVLQNSTDTKTRLQFYVFDLLCLRGQDLFARPLDERRDSLRNEVLPRLSSDIIFSESLDASVSEVIAAVKQQGLEGVVAKRRGSPYEAGKRSGAWVKLRINQGQELVIGGYVPSGGNFDSLAVGYYEGGDLLYVARVRNGFVPVLRARVFERFKGLEIKTCPFSNLPQRDKGRWGQGLTAEKMAECRWLKPELVAQIEYADWTDANHLRHSKFIALRDDKAAKDVWREMPQATKQIIQTAPPMPRLISAQKHAANEDPVFQGVTITHPDRIIDPESGLTKGKLAEYYSLVSPYLLRNV
jgi:DNA ligase D